jgi:hypothetical protein
MLQAQECSISFTSGATKNLVRRMVAVTTIAAAAMVIVTLTKEFSLRAQSRLPEESTGIDGIAKALVSAFDRADILALGEALGDVGRTPEFLNSSGSSGVRPSIFCLNPPPALNGAERHDCSGGR